MRDFPGAVEALFSQPIVDETMGSLFRRLLGLPLEVGRSAGNVFYVQAVKNAAGEIVERRTMGIDLDRRALALRTPRLSLALRASPVRQVKYHGIKSAQDFVGEASTVPARWQMWLHGSGEMPEDDDGPPVVSKPLDDDPDRGIRKQPAYSGDQTPAAPLEEK